MARVRAGRPCHTRAMSRRVPSPPRRWPPPWLPVWGLLLLLGPRPAAAAGPGLWVMSPPAASDPLPPVPDASPGRAPTPTTRSIAAALTVSAGATCIAAETLAEHVTSWLGVDTIAADITIEVRGDPFARNAAVILVRTPAGLIERAFDDGPPGCSDLHAVLGLAIAMAIDTSVLSGLGYEVIDSAPPPAVPQAVDSERPPLLARRRPNEPTPRRARLRAIAAARGGPWIGAVPGLGGGGQLHVELGWRPWFELRLGALGGYGGRRALGTGTVEFGLVAGRVDVCFGVQRRRLRPRLCIGPAAGVLQAVAHGFQATSDVVSPWLGATAALELRIVATRVFAVDVVLDGVVPFFKPLVAVQDPSKPGMIGDAVNFAPAGVMFGLGGAFTIR
jgi:hypothetical protein